MIEISGIFIQVLIFLLIFSFPFTPELLGNFFGLKKTFNLVDSHCINIIFFCYTCLFFSFLNFDLRIFFKAYFFLSIIFFFFNIKNLKLVNKSKDLILFFIFFLLVISTFFSIGQNLKLEWDGHFWFEKVLVFFNGENIENLKNTKANPGYPHLGSYIWAFFWKNSLIQLEYFGRLFYVYFYFASIFLILNSLKNDNYYLKILLLFSFFILSYDPFLFGGYQEYLIFSCLIIASRYISLINFSKIGDLRLIFLILFILYINVWFKNEGLVYFLIFSILLILYLNISLNKKILFFIFIFSLIFLQYFLKENFIGFFQFFHSGEFSSYLPDDFTNFEIFLKKIIKIFYYMIIGFIKYPLWLLIFIGIIVQFLVLKNNSIINSYFLSTLLINLFFIIFIFFAEKNLDFMLRVTLDRLLFQTSGFYLILFLLILSKIKIKL